MLESSDTASGEISQSGGRCIVAVKLCLFYAVSKGSCSLNLTVGRIKDDVSQDPYS